MSWRRLRDTTLQARIVQRAKIVRSIRDFFDSHGFVEVHTPRIVRVAGQEPYLHPMRVSVSDAEGVRHDGHLITSPEYACKKMLAAGFERVYDMGPCFRDREEFGGLHNPEFLMLEWYRTGVDYFALMDDVDGLLAAAARAVGREPPLACERISLDECFERYCGAPLSRLLDFNDMVEWARGRGYDIAQTDRFEDVVYRVFLNEIESQLGRARPTIVYDYPPPMAGLARIGVHGLAERCELYLHGIEIANGFSELIDAHEQRARLEDERQLRGELGSEVYDLDDDFIDALSSMRPAAGMALGVDRLVMVLLGVSRIEDVLAFPARELLN